MEKGRKEIPAELCGTTKNVSSVPEGLRLAYLLCERPELASACDWSKLDGVAWHCLLYSQPQFAVYCGWSFVSEWEGKLGRWYWATLLGKQPQFADKCDWSKFDETDLEWILRHQPTLVDHIDVRQQGGKVLALIIDKCPSAATQCCFGHFTGKDWCDLLKGLESVPETILSQCKWELLQGKDWVELLTIKMNYAQYCDWSKLDKHDWQELIYCVPEFKKQLDQFAPYNYDELDVENWEPV